jgi:hypothetical protein
LQPQQAPVTPIINNNTSIFNFKNLNVQEKHEHETPGFQVQDNKAKRALVNLQGWNQNVLMPQQAAPNQQYFSPIVSGQNLSHLRQQQFFGQTQNLPQSSFSQQYQQQDHAVNPGLLSQQSGLYLTHQPSEKFNFKKRLTPMRQRENSDFGKSPRNFGIDIIPGGDFGDARSQTSQFMAKKGNNQVKKV